MRCPRCWSPMRPDSEYPWGCQVLQNWICTNLECSTAIQKLVRYEHINVERRFYDSKSDRCVCRACGMSLGMVDRAAPYTGVKSPNRRI